jgi:beta-lactamase regulating signal transducer with metallopeptidase domain
MSGIIERLFLIVWEISWQASLLALLVLAVQGLFRRRLNPRWKSALWLVVLARLIMPWVPESPWSLQQIPTLRFVQTVEVAAHTLPESAPSESAPVPTLSSGWNLSLLFSHIWLAGVGIGSIVMLWSNLRFVRAIRRIPEIEDSRLRALLDECRLAMGLTSRPRVVVTGLVPVPAVMGLGRPVLLLPEEALRYTDGELRHIFLHELAHLRRGDHQLQWLIAVLHLLHWFNPVLALAFRRMRTDREPAADALALSCAGEGERESYGLALVKVLETRTSRPPFPLAVGILEDRTHLASRFRLIANFTPKAYAWSLLGALLLGALAVFGLCRPQKAAASAAVPAAFIHIQPHLMEINRKRLSSAELGQIDTLLSEGNFKKTALLPGVELATAPSATVQENRSVVIETTYDFELPVRYEPAPDGTLAPSKSEKFTVGLKLEASAQATSSGIFVSGTMTSREAGQRILAENRPPELNLTTNENRFSVLLKDGHPSAVCLWLSEDGARESVLWLTVSLQPPSGAAPDR